MIRPVCKDLLILGKKSEEATGEDMQTVVDLLDTLKANEDGCVGMAANMIGINKRIIAVNMGFINVAMINPVITKKTKPYKTQEGCLSLVGLRDTTRYMDIEIEYFDTGWNKKKEKYTGWIAQIIQHECDHLEGIII